MPACACLARASASATRARAFATSKLFDVASSIRESNSALPKVRYQSLPGQTTDSGGEAASKAAGTGCPGGFVVCNEHAVHALPIRIHGNEPCDQDISCPRKVKVTGT